MAAESQAGYTWQEALKVREEERERYRPLVEIAKELAQQEPIAEVGISHNDECVYCGAGQAQFTDRPWFAMNHQSDCPWLLLATWIKEHEQG